MIAGCEAIRVPLCRFRRYSAYRWVMQPPPADQPGTYADLRTAPPHITAIVLGLMRQPTRAPWGPPPGTAEHAERERGQAQQVADRIWAEAAHTGAVWGLADAPARIEVTAEQLAQLKEWPAEGEKQ